MSLYHKFFELTVCFLLLSLKAVQSWEDEIVCFLLEHHANLHIKDSRGNTALHYAVYGGNSAMAARLLEYGADIEERTKVRITLFRNTCDLCRANHLCLEAHSFFGMKMLRYLEGKYFKYWYFAKYLYLENTAFFFTLKTNVCENTEFLFFSFFS